MTQPPQPAKPSLDKVAPSPLSPDDEGLPDFTAWARDAVTNTRLTEEFDFVCPGFAPDPCGGPDGTYFSIGWPTQELAIARGVEHLRCHIVGEIMSELHDFREENSVTVENGVAVQNDSKEV